MALPSITLTKPHLLVTRSYSSLGIASQSHDFVFGYVEKVYSTCDFVTASQTVLFPLSKASQFLYGSTMYYLVDEAYVVFTEPLPL